MVLSPLLQSTWYWAIQTGNLISSPLLPFLLFLLAVCVFLTDVHVFGSVFAISPKRGKGGEKQEIHPKATSLELVEDKHRAIYAEQSKAPEHANLSTSFSCSPWKSVFCGHAGLLHHRDLRMHFWLFKNNALWERGVLARRATSSTVWMCWWWFVSMPSGDWEDWDLGGFGLVILLGIDIICWTDKCCLLFRGKWDFLENLTALLLNWLLVAQQVSALSPL